MVLALIYQGELLIFQSPLSRSSLKTKTTESDRYAKTIFGTIGGGLHYRGSLPFYSLTKIEKMKRYYFRIYQGSDFEDGDTVWTDANSEQEARNNIESDYWGINRLDLLRVR